jgi:hypothetical protein
LQDEAELKEIIRHEFVHVKQRHTHDIIWSELLCILNWYNPFVWLIRKAIRQNLEFIADNKVLEQGFDKKKYQYLLLKVTGNNHFSIANQFNLSSLKKRIAMMNKMKSARAQLIKFLFIVPLVAVMLLAFRNEGNKNNSQNNQTSYAPGQTGDFTDSVPDVELNGSGYYLDIKGKGDECIVLVRDKNKKEIERVPLTKWDQNKEYYGNLYGEIPPPPPPPPPGPPAPPTAPKLPDNVKSLTINNDEVIVLLKDGSTEKYDLNNVEEKKTFYKKYGNSLAPPPPPPPPHAVAGYTIAPGTVIDNSNVYRYSPQSDVTVRPGSTVYAPVHAELNVQEVRVSPTPAIAYVPIHTATTFKEVTVAGVNQTISLKPTKVITTATIAPAINSRVVADLNIESPVLTGGQAFTITSVHIAGETVLELKIFPSTTKERLNRLIDEAKAKDIKLEFDEMKFNKDDKLVSIGGILAKSNSKAQFVITDFEVITLRVTQKDAKYLCSVYGSTEKEVQ